LRVLLVFDEVVVMYVKVLKWWFSKQASARTRTLLSVWSSVTSLSSSVSMISLIDSSAFRFSFDSLLFNIVGRGWVSVSAFNVDSICMIS